MNIESKLFKCVNGIGIQDQLPVSRLALPVTLAALIVWQSLVVCMLRCAACSCTGLTPQSQPSYLSCINIFDMQK